MKTLPKKTDSWRVSDDRWRKLFFELGRHKPVNWGSE